MGIDGSNRVNTKVTGENKGENFKMIVFYRYTETLLSDKRKGRDDSCKSCLTVVKEFNKWREMIKKSVNDINKEREEYGIAW